MSSSADPSPHLHTAECNQLVDLFIACMQLNPLTGKYLNGCSREYHDYLLCFKKEVGKLCIVSIEFHSASTAATTIHRTEAADRRACRRICPRSTGSTRSID